MGWCSALWLSGRSSTWRSSSRTNRFSVTSSPIGLIPRFVSGRISIHPFTCSALRRPSADEGWESPRLFASSLRDGGKPWRRVWGRRTSNRRNAASHSASLNVVRLSVGGIVVRTLGHGAVASRKC